MTAAGRRYSGGAIVLHWLIALLLAGQMALGFAMPKDASGFTLYQLHKSIGITILFLTLVRIGWRLTHQRPAPIEGGASGFLASAVHAAFYAFMLAMPLTGWAVVSTAAIQVPTLIFGVVPWPHLPLPESLGDISEQLHEYIAFGGLALFALHVAGALRHHFLLHDGLLARMAPGGSAGAVLALLVGVIGLGGAVFFGVGAGPAQSNAEAAELAPLPALPELSEPVDLALAEPLDLADEENEAAEEESDTAEAESAEEQATDPEPAPEPTPEPTPEPAAAPPAWSIQPGGTLRFSVQNSGATLNGTFARWSGDIVMDPANPETAEIAITVELASATLGDATQDQMLRGPDFLGMSANPAATWRATSVRRTGGNSYEAQGTLTLKGTSRPQPLTFTLEGSGARRQVSGNATIDRNAFTVGTGPNAAGLAADVRLTFAFEATR